MEQDYRLKYIEERVEAHGKRIRDVEEMSKEFTKIATILEMQTEMNKKQDITLGKINDNLTTLNHSTSTLGERVSHLEVEVKDANSRDNVSIIGMFKKVGWTVLTLTIGVVMAWVFKNVDLDIDN